MNDVNSQTYTRTVIEADLYYIIHVVVRCIDYSICNVYKESAVLRQDNIYTL